jgi:hypothetical protein
MPNPGNVAAEPMAKIHRGLMERQLRDSGPELKLITVTLAAMAKVATERHVHRE